MKIQHYYNLCLISMVLAIISSGYNNIVFAKECRSDGQNYKKKYNPDCIKLEFPFSCASIRPCISWQRSKNVQAISGFFDTATVALRPDTRATTLTVWL